VSEGAHVAAVYASNTAAAQDLATRLSSASGSVSLHQADVSDRNACHRLVADVLDRSGHIDFLVNNAGLLIEASPRRMTAEEWDLAIATNLSSAFFLSQAVLESMIDRGFGRIVNVSSVTAFMGNASEAGYGAAKAGLLGLTRSLARSVARRGITVNLVVPGVFETEMAQAIRQEAQEAILAMIPLGRRGNPSELAHAVAYLLDDRAGFMTGSVVTVDGGLSMGG